MNTTVRSLPRTRPIPRRPASALGRGGRRGPSEFRPRCGTAPPGEARSAAARTPPASWRAMLRAVNMDAPPTVTDDRGANRFVIDIDGSQAELVYHVNGKRLV